MTRPKHLLTKFWDEAVHRARVVPGTRPEVWQESPKHDSPFVRVVLVNVDDGQPYEMSPRIRTHYVSLFKWASRKYGGKTTEERRASWRRAYKMWDRIMGARTNKVKNTREVPAEAPYPILKRRGPRLGTVIPRKKRESGVENQPLTPDEGKATL